MNEDIRPVQDSDWPEQYEVKFAELEAANSEEPFLEASFELLKEAAGLTIFATGILLDENPGHDRNQAILVGHLVRMVKLMRSTIRAIVDDHGGDQQMQITRQFLDSASALAYFLDDYEDTSRLDAYVNDSLIAEREFLADIQVQIRERGGKKLPIEERIEHSIATTFATAGMQAQHLPSRAKNGWPNAQQRLKLLGPTAYAAYRMGSGSIHGSWHDLERNHLDLVDGLFVPDHESARQRPQPLFAMALLAVTIVRDYIAKRYPTATDLFEDRFTDLEAKLEQADQLHEAYLTARMAKRAED